MLKIRMQGAERRFDVSDPSFRAAPGIIFLFWANALIWCSILFWIITSFGLFEMTAGFRVQHRGLNEVITIQGLLQVLCAFCMFWFDAVCSLNHLVRFGKDDDTVSCAGLKSSQFQGWFRYCVLNLDAVCSLNKDPFMCSVGDADSASRAGLEAIWRQRS